ncbi:DUF6150 family protein [Janthinobacterium sp. 1_2014MBL_MicDiv]|uniref:DUF6150 family protein n=1 Tax=Janthinobacterium sp. 1_2014MBL_MicDiv TaxID=1644131 RepID=UPI0008F4F453|nr:DUF6150 family protein [Janthinobacterium sp. 1_2014MBL_MicDiv]APA68715.1 hypothetical protein YQ44_13900 [Janthinobacterium sp. 1_2014MBL_MicDiv]
MARIYHTSNMGEATVRVALVARDNAELLVHRPASLGMAHGDAMWFFIDDRKSASACVYFCSPGMAHLSICFVDRAADAGWQVARPKHIHL